MIEREKLSEDGKHLFTDVVLDAFESIDWFTKAKKWDCKISMSDKLILDDMAEACLSIQPEVKRTNHSGEPDFEFPFEGADMPTRVYVLKPNQYLDLPLVSKHAFFGGEHGSFISVESFSGSLRWYETYPFDLHFIEWLMNSRMKIDSNECFFEVDA